MRQSEFIYGTHYHRPPNPPEDQHGFHLHKIKEELGYNIVKFRIQWNYIEREKGKLSLDEVNKMFDYCDELGLKVVLEINLETAPYWMERNYPETRYVSANGHVLEMGGYESTQAGGYPGLCYSNSIVKEEAARYLKLFITAVKHRKSLYLYDCWNEPHMEPAWQSNYWGNMGDKLYCYCNACRSKFRKWMEAKYGNINEVNRVWARAFTEFGDINPPSRHGTYADWLDWMRFWHDELSGHIKWRYDIIGSIDPGRPVKSHSGAVPPLVPRANAFIHNWKFAQNVDIWGTSFAPKFFNWSFADANAILEATRSAARGKQWWITEMSGGCLYDKGFRNKMPYPRPKDIRAWNWLGASAGAKGICYWCYLTESTGPEAGGFGLIKYNGETTERARETAIQKELLNKYFHIFKDFVPVTQVALLYDPDNSSLMFAMENNDELYGQSFIGYSRVLFRNDYNVRYVTYDTIDDITEKVLIIPMCLILNEQTARKIEKFVECGGVVITDCRLGLFDERGFLQPTLPSFGLHRVAGLKEDECFYTNPDFKPTGNNPQNLPWPDDIYQGPKISVNSPVVADIQTAEFISPLLLEDAECLGSYGDTTAFAVNCYGQGEVYYFGTYAGLAMHRGDSETEKVLSAILSKYIKPVIKGNVLRPRLMDNGREALLCIFNEDGFAKQTDTIEIGDYRSAVSIFDGAEVPVKDGCVTLEVGAEDVTVLLLSS